MCRVWLLVGKGKNANTLGSDGAVKVRFELERRWLLQNTRDLLGSCAVDANERLRTWYVVSAELEAAGNTRTRNVSN